MELNDDQFGYRDQHRPDEEGAPLHDLTLNDTFPKDVYDTLHYYHGSDTDRQIIRANRGRTKGLVTIYRAVPIDAGSHTDIKQRLNQSQKELDYYRAKGKLPTWWKTINGNSTTSQAGTEFYDWTKDTINKLSKHLEETPKQEIRKINPGDWVAIDRNYAVEHGESRFNGKYRILSKQVPARHVRNGGDDLSEWGYFPND